MSKKCVYSMREKALLAALVENNKKVLECKKTDSTSNKLKSVVWEKIATEYNANDVAARTAAQLKRCWENLKYKTRKADTEAKHYMLQTGGGPSQTNNEDDYGGGLEEIVRSIVPSINYTIKNNWDSTADIEQENDLSFENTADVISISEYNENSAMPNSLELVGNIHDIKNKQYDIKTNNESNSNKGKIKRTKGVTVQITQEESELRVMKLRESIDFQRHLQQKKIEAVEAEKTYWNRKTALLEK